MLGFQLDAWDYITFASLMIITLGTVLLVILILGLPGKIAIARKHPEAEAVNLMGWVGFLAIVPWIQALIWAFKPADVVDIRRYPSEVAAATEEEIQRLSGKLAVKKTKKPKDEKPEPKSDFRDGEES